MMCKEVGAYPKCNCPAFVEPDSTPGVMTWPELLEHMDNLVAWGQDKLKEFQKMSVVRKGVRVKHAAFRGADGSESCEDLDLLHRHQVQNRLAGACEDMCKEVGAYPKCNCPAFVEPDSTPGVMTWPELLEHMDNLVAWGQGMLKSFHAQASQLQTNVTDAACMKEDVMMRGALQNKLASECEKMCKEVGAYPK